MSSLESCPTKRSQALLRYLFRPELPARFGANLLAIVLGSGLNVWLIVGPVLAVHLLMAAAAFGIWMRRRRIGKSDFLGSESEPYFGSGGHPVAPSTGLNKGGQARAQ